MGNKCDSGISPREAIEMIQRCRKDRLPYVLDILKAAGYEFSSSEINLSRANKMSREQMSSYKRNRKHNEWAESNDETVQLLREAYLVGVSFTDINKLTGINRTVLYEYLKGAREVPEAYKDDLTNTLKTVLTEINRRK